MAIAGPAFTDGNVYSNAAGTIFVHSAPTPAVEYGRNKSAAAIAMGDWVELEPGTGTPDLLGNDIQVASVSATLNTVWGVAAADIPINASGPVVREGIVEGANVATAVTEGQELACGAVSGRAAANLTGAIAGTTPTRTRVGVALADSVANRCKVRVLCNG